MKVQTACLSCSTIFESYKSQNRKFCTRECQGNYLKTPDGALYKSSKIVEGKVKRNTLARDIRICKKCKTKFECLPSEPNKFCSAECRYQHLSDNKGSMLIKQQETNRERYGATYHMQNNSIIEKMRGTVLEKYGNVINHPRYSEQSRIKSVNTCLERYGKPYAPSFVKESKDEKELLDYIKAILPNTQLEENNRTLLGGKEIDIYIPALKVAIEYNGLYYHSETYIEDKNYHLNKTNQLLKQGIRLIHIFSDEWKLKNDIVKKKLASILGVSAERRIYARSCKVVEIDRTTCSQFLTANHIQGADKSRIKLGLYNNTELVAIMTFSVGRQMMGSKNRNGVYELSRFATSCNVIGGGSKLLKYFIRNYQVESVISYADRRWSVGNVYTRIGFEEVGKSKPSYWYTADYRTRLYRYNFRKSILVANGAPSNLSESAIMKSLGYDRVWDCGTIKYELKVATYK